MRIGIDGREIERGVRSDTGRALYHFLTYVEQVINNDRIFLFVTRRPPFRFSKRIEVKVVRRLWNFWWEQIQIPPLVSRLHLDVFYTTCPRVPLAAPALRVMSLGSSCSVEGQMSRGSWLYHETYGRRYAREAERVLTTSQFLKDAIIRDYQIDRRKVDTLPESVSEGYRPSSGGEDVGRFLEALGIRRPYLLYGGDIRSDKNLKTLVRAFHAVRVHHPGVSLVIAGEKTAEIGSLFRLALRLDLHREIFFPGDIARTEERRLLYSGAEAFVLPSLHEGFGLRAFEAMACGIPVVAARSGALPETMGNAAFLVDATQDGPLAEGILRVLEDRDLAHDLVNQGFRRAGELSEALVAKRTYDYFQNLPH
ncbi:MAG: glycosyltransferase family 4 protein [Elusimicrobia bacterium]|nr:glycosyltransferase family 4 protein [Elusimicrobiota bacterium]